MSDETAGPEQGRAPLERSAARWVAEGLTVPMEVDREVRAHVEREYPHEACGVLLGVRTGATVRIERAIPCANVAAPAERPHSFRIDARELFRLGRRLGGAGRGFVGFFHSHPNAPAEPSPADMDFMRLWPETVWWILPVAGGGAGAGRGWWLHSPHDAEATELVVRKLAPGGP